MRLTFVQYGDFSEAANSFDVGGDETYAAQRYSVDLVRQLKQHCEDICVICVTSSYEEKVLPEGVRTIGFHLYHQGDERALTQLVSDQRPSHLIARSPILRVLQWSAAQNIRTLPLLATSFPSGGLKDWFRYRRIARALSSSNITWIGNHSINSANALRRIGVDPHRIVPWDWPPTVKPTDWPAKLRRGSEGLDLKVFFAGTVQETKGIGDCIRAIAVLRQKGIQAQLTVAGAGNIDHYRALAGSVGVENFVAFLGRIPHRDVIQKMHEQDVVVVPSQHGFPEGLPMTIYDTYTSRSPLVASDHPMFRSRVRDQETALVFPAQDEKALAACLERLRVDDQLYAKLSAASAEAWERLQIPVKWGELLRRWLSDSPADHEWQQKYSLANYSYLA